MLSNDVIIRYRAAALVLAALSTTACAAGAGKVLPANALRSASSVSSSMSMDYGGVPSLASAGRRKLSSGGGVAATYAGTIVATGTLDAGDRATLIFSSAVPRGATVLVAGAGMTVSVVLARSDAATIVAVTSSGDGTVVVSASAASNSSESSTIREDANGAPLAISTTMQSLPANLPVTITATCTSVTVSPSAGPLAHVLVELKVRDGDGDAAFRHEGALDAPLTAPIGAGASRLHVRIYDATGGTALDVQAPVTAQTTSSSGCSAPPTPGPTATANAAPTANATASPLASASPSPSPSAAADPSPPASASPAATASPIASPSPAASASPSPSPVPTATEASGDGG